MEAIKCKTAENVLTEKDLKTIIHNSDLDGWEILGYDIKSSGQGMSGFLGDHFRMVLHLQKEEFTKKLHLFAKFLPLLNKPKAQFIDEYNFFKRENLIYELFECMGVYNELEPWCPKALLNKGTLIVMPDLCSEGYKSIPQHDCLDIKHVSAVMESLARFHASFANYEAKRDIQRQRQSSFYEDHKDVLRESKSFNSPWSPRWLRVAAKLVVNFLHEFTTNVPKINNLEDIIAALFIQACDDLAPKKDSLNVIVHRDLWLNNIFFRHEHGQPIKALLIDFQCVRYAPPAFDVMIFLYLTTTKEFRAAHEKNVINHYFTIFTENLDDIMKDKLKYLKYGRCEFLACCEGARLFALAQAMAIFPFVLMSPLVAQRTFDNPDTFSQLMDDDRSQPVLEYAKECTVYKERQLQVNQEFLERYVLKRKV